MTTVQSLISGFIGYGDGQEIRVETGQVLDATHPAVVARPKLFTEPAAPAVITGPTRKGPRR